MGSLVPRLRRVVDGHLMDVFGPDPAGVELTEVPSAEPCPPRLLHPPAAAEAEETPALPQEAGPATGRWDLLEACRLDPNRPPVGSYQRKSDLVVSTTDPDAAPMKPTGQRASLGYHDHYVVDGGKARIILHALITPADVMENEPMLDQLRRVRFRWKVQPARAVADTTYATAENIRALEDSGIRAYVPLPDWDRTPYYGPSRFAYDAERDEYRCPQGEPLRREKAKYTERVVVYRAAPAACNACPRKAACTASDAGRIIHRSFDAEYIERVRGYHASAAYRQAMRKRQVWVEPLFAEAKQWHGLRQFRLRGLQRVNMEGLLIAAGQNLKRWLSATGWGRRHGPSGSLAATGQTTTLLLRPR